MTLRIERLTPGHVEDYLALFDGAFDDNPRWVGCLCAFYDDPCSDDEWDSDDPEFATRNRANRTATIAAGHAAGLLAYDGDRPVGWINAAKRESYGNLRIFATAIEDGDPAIGSIMCFVIHPEHRGRGVATALLDAADGHLRDLGAAVAEAYPRAAPPENPDFPWTAAFYKGTREMYERAGYAQHAVGEGFLVMRKPL